MALDCDTRFTPACVARKIPNLDFKHFTAACASYLCPGPCYGQGNGVLPLPHVCSEVSASASPSHGPSPSLWAQQRSAWAEKAWQSNTSQKAKLQLKILQPKIVLTFFFPTCQVRVVRFYVSCLLLSSPPPRPPRPPAQPRPSTHSVLCRTSTTTIHAQCSLPDLNHDHPRPVFPAGPQPRVSPPSVPCRTSTTTIHAQCSLPDLNREYPRQKICHIECQKICQIEC